MSNYDHGVTAPIVEVSPADGPVTILPLDLWREKLARTGLGDANDRELADAAYDLLCWEEELTEEPPRRRRVVTGTPQRRKSNPSISND